VDKCTDLRMGNRLYAYETGLLTGPELEEFELHLLTCKFCNDRAQAFRQEARMIRHDPDIKKVAAELAHTEEVSVWYRSPLVRTSLAVAAVLIVLLLRPWQLEFRMSQTAVAEENRLVVFHFDNLGDPSDTARLGEVIANLIITDVSNLPALRVVSDQRLRDVIKRLTSEDATLSGTGIATRVAQETHSRWTLAGSIVQAAPTLIVTTQLCDATTGDVLSAHRVEGAVGQTVFALADSLTVLLRNDLSLPEAPAGFVDLPVAEVTTSSAEAYRLYLEGLDYFSKYYVTEAAELFSRAVDIDSTFAMAYYYLAKTKSRTYVEQAVRYADRVTPKERLYIESLELAAHGDIEGTKAKLETLVAEYPDEKQAWYDLGRYAFGQFRLEETIRYCLRALELDPLYKLPYNTLAYAFSELQNVDSALWAIDAYIRLASEEPNPYDTRGDICAEYGRLDEAITAYTRAVEIKRDFSAFSSLLKLGEIYVLKGEYESARGIFQEVATGDQKSARSRARTGLALIPLQRGKLDSALLVLNDGIAADRLEQATSGAQGDRALKHNLKADVYREKRHLDSALLEIRTAVEIHNQAYPDDRYAYRYFLAQALAESGKIDSARALADTLRQYLEQNRLDLSGYCYALGCIELARGHADQAALEFEKSVRESDTYHGQYMWGIALCEAGQFRAAARVLSSQLDRYTNLRRHQPVTAVRCYYQLGMAYEELGQPEEAIVQYRRFLTQWTDADSDLVSVKDARRRLARLTSTP
jgi:tetratricopeptide (TPR) repeat protein